MSETTRASTFALLDEHAQMGKIGNNLEKHGDTDEMLGWTLPITAMLPHDQIDALKGEYFHRSLYNINKNPWEVVEGFKDCAPLEDERTFEGVKALLSFQVAKRELEFEGCRVTKIVFEAQLGGLTKTSFHLYVHPEIGDETSLLLEHQNSEVSITLADGKVALKKNPKQQSLPLDPPKADKVTAETDAKLDNAVGRAPAVESKGGDAIDAELHARHPEASGEVMGADAHPDPDATSPGSEGEAYSGGGGIPANGNMDPDLEGDMQRFEEGAKKNLEAFTSVSETGVIDGRSERVKHQDRKRGRGGKAA